MEETKNELVDKQPQLNRSELVEKLKEKLMFNYTPKQVDKVAMFKEIVDKMVNIYQAKNKDYNDSFGENYRKHGILGILNAVARIGDKYRRIDNYATNVLCNTILSLNNSGDPLEIKDETISDTLLDMASYCIMTAMELILIKEEKNEQ